MVEFPLSFINSETKVTLKGRNRTNEVKPIDPLSLNKGFGAGTGLPCLEVTVATSLYYAPVRRVAGRVCVSEAASPYSRIGNGG